MTKFGEWIEVKWRDLTDEEKELYPEYDKKPIDKTKKTNIKCEWSKTGYCWNPDSKNFQLESMQDF